MIKLGLAEIFWLWSHGDWGYGCELYEGKPLLGIFFLYYDGWHFSAHLGPFWIECNS